MDRKPLSETVDKPTEAEVAVQEERAAKNIEQMGFNDLDVFNASKDFRQFCDFLQIDVGLGKENQDELLFLVDWAKEKSSSEDMVDITYEIKKMKDSLGFNDVGLTSVKRLYQYIRLTDEQGKIFDRLKRIKKEKELLRNA